MKSIEGIDRDNIRIDNKTYGKVKILKSNPNSEGIYECKLGSMKPMIASKQKSLKVLKAPEEGPKILDSKQYFAKEKIIEIKCKTENSRPGVKFFWKINGINVGQNSNSVQTSYETNNKKLLTSLSTINITISEWNQNDSKAIDVKCNAFIDDWYQSSSDLLVINADDYRENDTTGKGFTTSENLCLIFILLFIIRKFT